MSQNDRSSTKSRWAWLAAGRGISLGLAIALSSSLGLVSLAQSRDSDDQGVDPTAEDVVVNPNPGATDQPRFVCQLINGQYTVMYLPESRPGEAYPWAVPGLLGGGWTPERRCQEISRRLESYRPDGLLEMRTGTENGYNTVCVTTQRNAACQIVFTVPPGQDPLSTRDRVFQNLTIADSGQQTQGVNTFANRGDRSIEDLVDFGLSLLTGGTGDRPSSSAVSRRNAIPLRPFLDPADGGTGKALKRGVSVRQNNPRFNPDQFR